MFRNGLSKMSVRIKFFLTASKVRDKIDGAQVEDSVQSPK
jgi:hypothetical protein